MSQRIRMTYFTLFTSLKKCIIDFTVLCFSKEAPLVKQRSATNCGIYRLCSRTFYSLENTFMDRMYERKISFFKYSMINNIDSKN